MLKKIPDENDKHEIAGRIYEAVDIQMAIESGKLKTIDDVLEQVRLSSDGLSKVLKCSEWVYSGDFESFLDVEATVNQAISTEV